MGEENWKTQLKKIEREFDGLPPEPSPALQKMQTETERRAHKRSAERASAIGAAGRLLLVLALGVGLVLWPYPRACGQDLFTFLAAEVVFIAAGVWIATYTWRHGMPRTHVLALLIVLAGLVLVAAEALPRNGYAAVDPKNPPQWWCTAP
ncbi:MAG: hypothetical protein M3365_04095 [Gemmatimonadota bacterium]|nr:hypothetical protein [Gemmatimonadota bacterium]